MSTVPKTPKKVDADAAKNAKHLLDIILIARKHAAIVLKDLMNRRCTIFISLVAATLLK